MRSTLWTGRNRRIISVLLGILIAQLHPTGDWILARHVHELA